MDFDLQPPPLAIDDEECSAANIGAAAAEADCRRAETLFHAGKRAEALEYCRRALPSVEADAAMLRICAWVFSNNGCHEEAAGAYRDLLRLCPDWKEGHRHLSSALAAMGQSEEAAAHAVEASNAAPDDLELTLHTGSLLLAAGRSGEAADHFRRAVAAQPDNPTALNRLAAAEAALGRRDPAAALALRAAHHAAGDPDTLVDAAEILMLLGRAGTAADLLHGGSEIGNARLFRVLSAAEMVDGRLDAALAAADRAVDLAPSIAEYQLHRAHLLCRTGDVAAAAVAVDRAAAIDPESRELKRAQLDLFLSAGLERDAIAVGGALLQRFPDDKPAAEAVLHLLTRRLETIDGEYRVLSDVHERAIRPERTTPDFPARLRAQWRIIEALIIRESRTRFAEAKLGYGWALLEPILHIALLSVTFAVLMHGQPPIGTHFFLFYYTGLIPYLVFVHASSGMSHAIVGNGPVLQLPPVTPFDVITARGLLEVVTDIVVAGVLLLLFGALGVAAAPDDLWESALAFLVIAMLGCGCGFVNAIVTVFLRSWEKIYSQLTRVLYFVSGIFYVPGMMPDWARDTLAWNPLLHAIDWFRAGFFASYQPHWLDRSYLTMLAILSLLAGFVLERTLHRKLTVPL